MHLFTPAVREEWARVCWLEKAFADDECDRIIQLASNALMESATVGDSVSSEQLRRSEIAWLPTSPDTEWMFQKLSKLVMDVNNERYRFDLAGFTDDLQYTEYREEGHYGWHQDFAPGQFSTRKLSMVVNLSGPDDYEGGTLELFGEEGTIPRSRGTIVYFPSFEFHRVTPVTRGTRRSLVCWAVGPVYR